MKNPQWIAHNGNEVGLIVSIGNGDLLEPAGDKACTGKLFFFHMIGSIVRKRFLSRIVLEGLDNFFYQKESVEPLRDIDTHFFS